MSDWLTTVLRTQGAYATKTLLRSAPAPSFGATAVTQESPAALWAWTPGATGTDDNATILTPASSADAALGRWLVVNTGTGTITTGGDLSGVVGLATVTGLRGRSVSSATPTDGNVLAWSVSSNAWIPSIVSASTVPWAGVTSTPTTTAGYGISSVAWSLLTGVPSVSNAQSGLVPSVGASGTVPVSTGTAAAWGTVGAAGLTPGSAYQSLVTNSGATAAAWGTLTLGVSAPLTATNSGNVGQGTTIGIGSVSSSAAGIVGASSASAIYGTLAGNTPGWQTAPVCASLSASSFLAVSATPAATGDVRLGDTGAINFKGHTSGDISGLSKTTTDYIQVGSTAVGVYLGPTTQMVVSGGTATRVNVTDTEATFSFGGSTGNIKFREWAGGAAYAAVYLGLGGTAPSNANYALVGSSSDLLVNAPSAGGTLYLRTGNSDRATLSSSYVELVPASLRFRSGIAAPVIGQADNATTPQPIYFTAGNVTTGTGGDVNVSPGSGSVASGNLNLRMGGTAGPIALQISPTGITETRVSGMSPPTTAPSSGTVLRYVSNGEAACPAPSGAVVTYDPNGASWKASKKSTGITTGSSTTIALGTVGLPWSSAKFATIVGRLRVTGENPTATDSGRVVYHAVFDVYAATAGGTIAVCPVALEHNITGAIAAPVLTVGGALNGASGVSGGAVVATVSQSSGATLDLRIDFEGFAAW